MGVRRARTVDGKGWWRELRRAILERDRYICYICGRPANTVDHLQPLSKGGSNHPDNLAACCKPCNNRKHATWHDRTITSVDW